MRVHFCKQQPALNRQQPGHASIMYCCVLLLQVVYGVTRYRRFLDCFLDSFFHHNRCNIALSVSKHSSCIALSPALLSSTTCKLSHREQRELQLEQTQQQQSPHALTLWCCLQPPAPAGALRCGQMQ